MTVVPLALLALLLSLTVLSFATAPRRMVRLAERVSANRALLSRFYLRATASTWTMAAFVPLIVAFSADLSASDVGWAWPHGGGLDYALAALVSLMLAMGSIRGRRHMREGRSFPVRARLAFMMPQSPRERVLSSLWVASAGVTEELVFRGLFVGAGSRYLSLTGAVVASLAFFVWAHAYQGRSGMLGAGLLGAAFTAIFVLSGSILLPVLVHVVHNLIVTLVVPAHPTVESGVWASPGEVVE